MKQYKPIATYSTMEDIVDMFPCDAIKPDMADIIYSQYKDGAGEPHKYEEPDPEANWDEDEVAEDENFLLTKDGKHGVRFTRGTMVKSNGFALPYGYYIDIYELIN